MIYNWGVSNASLRGGIEPWNMSTEYTLSRYVSRLKIWSRRIVDSENTHHILLWVRGCHSSNLLLCPAVAEVLVVGIATNKTANSADQAADSTRDKAGHCWRK